MSYQNSIRYTSQPPLELDFRQSLSRRRGFDLPGGKTLWLAAAKLSVAVVGLALCLSLVLSYTTHQTGSTIQEIEAQRHQLQNELTVLQNERDALMSKNRVLIHAEAKLALVVPAEHQVRKL